MRQLLLALVLASIIGIKEVKAKLQALSQDPMKMWNYIHKNFNVIFNEKSQVELWKN